MDPGAALIKAAKSGDLNAVRWCFAHGADVDFADANQLTPLMYAASGGHGDIAEFLLSAGANVDKASSTGETALTFARRVGHHDIARLINAAVQVRRDGSYADMEDANLADLNALLELLEGASATVLVDAVTNGTLEKVRDVANAENVNYFDTTDGTSPLHVAAKRGRSDMIKLLIDLGALKDTADKTGQTALHYACSKGDLSCVRSLLSNKVNEDAVDNYGLAAIDMAVIGGHLDLVRELNRQGASLKTISKDGETILHRAVKSENVELIEFLVNQNVEVNAADAGGRTPLHLALRLGKWRLCEKMLTFGATMNNLATASSSDPSTSSAQSMLEMAVEGDSSEMLALLLAQDGIDLNIRNADGRTLLIAAAAKGRAATVKQLVDAGADLNAQGKAGETALIMATIGGFAKAVHVLLEYGARTDIASHSGKTPLTVAKSAELRGLLQLYHNSQQYHDKCFALLNDVDANPTVDKLTELVPLITSVYDLRLMLTLISINTGKENATGEIATARRQLVKSAFTHVVTRKFTYDDQACVFFKMSIEHCEREGLLQRSDALLLDRQAEKVNTESASWVIEMKKQVYVNSWRLDAHDQHLHAVVTGLKEVHAMVMENRKVLVKVSRRVGGLQKQVSESKKLLAQLQNSVHRMAKDMGRFESRLNASEENIKKVASSLQSFREAYVDRLRQEERNVKIKRVCGIVASVAGFVFAPVLKEVADAVVDFVNPIDIVEKVYGELDIAKFLSDGSEKVLPKAIQEQLEKCAIPKDEFETLLREEIVLQHPEYVAECEKRGLLVSVDGGQSDVARSMEPVLDTEEVALLKLVGELHAALGDAVQSKFGTGSSSNRTESSATAPPPPRLNVTVPAPSFANANVVIPSSLPGSPLVRPPGSPSPPSRPDMNYEVDEDTSARDSTLDATVRLESLALHSPTISATHSPTFPTAEAGVVFMDDLEAFHFHMAVNECGGELSHFTELVEMIDATTCDPTAAMRMEIREGAKSREALCAAEYAYCRGFADVGDLLASRMKNAPLFDKTPASLVELVEDVDDFPFVAAVDESQGDVEECEQFLELVDEQDHAMGATIQADVVRGTNQSVQWSAVEYACHLGYVDVVKYLLKGTVVISMKTKFQMLKAVRERSLRLVSSSRS